MTVVDICNQALSHIGDLNITSLDEPNKSARLCSQFYPIARDKVLSDYEWSFATAYKSLGQITQAPEHSGYDYQFALPKDVLQILEVVDAEDFEVIGSNIHSNKAPLTIKYVKREENSETYPSAVIEAISMYLAYKLSTPLAADLNLKQMLLQEYVIALEDAKGKDGLLSEGETLGKFWVDTI